MIFNFLNARIGGFLGKKKIGKDVFLGGGGLGGL